MGYEPIGRLFDPTHHHHEFTASSDGGRFRLRAAKAWLGFGATSVGVNACWGVGVKRQKPHFSTPTGGVPPLFFLFGPIHGYVLSNTHG